MSHLIHNLIYTIVSILALFTYSDCQDSINTNMIHNGFVAIASGGLIYKNHNDHISDLIRNEYGFDSEGMIGGLNYGLGARLGFQLSKTTGISEYDKVIFDGEKRSQNINFGLCFGRLFYSQYIYVMPQLSVEWNYYVVNQPQITNKNSYSKTFVEYPYGLTFYVPIHREVTKNYINAKCLGISVKTTNYGAGINNSSYYLGLTYSVVGWSFTK